MENLEMIQKLAVLTNVYQLIASADGSVKPERDNATIDAVSKVLGFTSKTAFNLLWNAAIMSNPHEAFECVSKFSRAQKIEFSRLIILVVNGGGNKTGRSNCAQQIFQYTKC